MLAVAYSTTALHGMIVIGHAVFVFYGRGAVVLSHRCTPPTRRSTDDRWQTMIVRFTSTQEAIAFLNWLTFHGITGGDVAAAIESDFRAAQEFFGATLLRFRAEQERRIALERWLELLESEE